MDELNKFVGKEGKVVYAKGDKLVSLKGTIKGINFNHLSVAVMTKTEKILLKHIIEIRRKRDFPKKKK